MPRRDTARSRDDTVLFCVKTGAHGAFGRFALRLSDLRK